jgi:hypothetical protein
MQSKVSAIDLSTLSAPQLKTLQEEIGRVLKERDG